jgi:hypothetical protein
VDLRFSEPELSHQAKSHLFDTSDWGPFCDVTLTLKQARKCKNGIPIKIDEYECKRAFQHFMNLLNRAVYGNAFRNCGKRLRVIPVLEQTETVRDPQETTVLHRGRYRRAFPLRRSGTSGRWHFHCAIELPQHIDAITFEKLVEVCWKKVDWGHRRILVRDGADDGWINYILKSTQKSQFESWADCIVLEALYNPIANA